jgi:hypothetical protein
MNYRVPSPPMVTVAYMRQARDADRRRYRTNVIYLVMYQIIVAMIGRIGVDFLPWNTLLKDVIFLKPFSIVVPLIFVIAVWLVGLHVCFKRNY